MAKQQLNHKVIVIGAGAAGLAAARTLHDAGHQVQVLEARERLGGRMFTSYDWAPYPVEIGASAIHGRNTITFKLITKYRFHTSKDASGHGKWYVYANDYLYDDLEATDLPPFEVYEFIPELAEHWAKTQRQDANLLHVIESWVRQHRHRLSMDMWRLTEHLITAEWAAHPQELSTFGIAQSTYANDGEGDYRIDEGYSRLAQRLSRRLQIEYNAIVQKIAWQAENGVAITLTDGREYSADRVVITLPLGVLQSGDVQFSPPLPERKRQAIKKLGAGPLGRLILRFGDRFWPGGMAGFVTTHPTQLWWRAALQHDHEVFVWTSVFGGDAERRYAHMSPEAVVQEALDHWVEIFGPVAAKTFVRGEYYSWSKDPFSKMGYSYVPLGGVGQRAVLAETVANVLYFAGEATHTIRPSSVHGAFESGYRAAHEIIQHVATLSRYQ
ncbi:MAG: hypothetical protein CUN55_09340 [Phototrophicales bacterium]|nr:MAG: hypothetical protein CUN55_09340 [Phototrophicales bacterium]